MPDNVRRFHWKQSGEMSAADLVRECGERLTDRELWREFQNRFQGLIFLYLMRSLRIDRIQDDAADIVPDLAQEVYLRLVQPDGRTLRSFRGTTEFSVMAFLAKVSSSVVHDYVRQNIAARRRGQVVPIEEIHASEQTGSALPNVPELESGRLSSILS